MIACIILLNFFTVYVFHDYWTLSDSIISQKDHNVDVIFLSIVEHAIYAQYENNKQLEQASTLV